MEINNLKELQKLIALCRKTGVESLRLETLELKLGPAPIKTQNYDTFAPHITEVDILGLDPGSIAVPKEHKNEAPSNLEELTPEQLLMWSAGNNQ